MATSLDTGYAAHALVPKLIFGLHDVTTGFRFIHIKVIARKGIVATSDREVRCGRTRS